MAREIERKWLMNGWLDFPYDWDVSYTQSYLSFDPQEVRISRSVPLGKNCDESIWYKMTVKDKGGLNRKEVETFIEEYQYYELKEAVLASANKHYREYLLPDGYTLVCGCVDDDWFYSEIEFANEEEANAYIPCFEFKEEVTDQRYWNMAEYCRRKIQPTSNPWDDKELFTPTVQELCDALAKFKPNDKIWFDTPRSQYTPIKHLNGSYSMVIGDSSYANTIYIKLEE